MDCRVGTRVLHDDNNLNKALHDLDNGFPLREELRATVAAHLRRIRDFNRAQHDLHLGFDIQIASDQELVEIVLQPEIEHHDALDRINVELGEAGNFYAKFPQDYVAGVAIPGQSYFFLYKADPLRQVGDVTLIVVNPNVDGGHGQTGWYRHKNVFVEPIQLPANIVDGPQHIGEKSSYYFVNNGVRTHYEMDVYKDLTHPESPMRLAKVYLGHVTPD